jgi:hypothetical protein
MGFKRKQTCNLLDIKISSMCNKSTLAIKERKKCTMLLVSEQELTSGLYCEGSVQT